MFSFRALTGLVAAILPITGLAHAQEAGANNAELAQKLANPIASLISVPIQMNYDHGFGPQDGDKVTTNIQPVIPFKLNDNFSLVTRTILPVVWQDDIAGNSGTQFGLSDTLQSFFLVPTPQATSVGAFTWGIGPAFTWPTSTDPLLGLGTWGAGPTGVFLFQTPTSKGSWTWGALVNQQWGYAETRGNVPDLNNTFLQPFLSFTTPSAWTFTLNTESTYNWTSNEWSVPINFAISKLTSIGEQKVQFQGGVGYWAESPTNGPEDLRARFTVTFLFPG